MKNIAGIFMAVLTTVFSAILGGCVPQLEEPPLGGGYLGDGYFTEPLSNAFNYCPSIMQPDENTRYIFYCANIRSGIIQDHIIGRKGTKVKGVWQWTEKKVVLAPREGEFDALHCCDPTVIEGKFDYRGTSYKYLMAYTGNTGHLNNKVGLAVSNDLLGDWLSLPDPLITYGGDPSHWGVGQPALVSVDKQGKAMLFYSVGSTVTKVNVERWDFSDLENPAREFSSTLTTRGLTNLNGQTGDPINNVDCAYDPVNKRFYAVSDCHPNPDPAASLMDPAFRVTYIDDIGAAPGDVFASLESMAGRGWATVEVVGESKTGYERNANAGLVTDSYGWLIDQKSIDVYYSKSETIGTNHHWTYRIFMYPVSIIE
jgi:hypothetical protein